MLPIIELMSSDGIQALRRYLVQHYDDPHNGVRKQPDLLEIVAFLREEGIPCIEWAPQQFEVASLEGFERWRSAFVQRTGLTSVTSVSLEDFRRQILPHPVPGLRGPAAATPQLRRPLDDPWSAAGARQDFERLLAVGDAHASRQTNSDLTVRLARPNMPTSREYVVPIDPASEMRLTVAFDSVDWPPAAVGTVKGLQRPSRAFLVPDDYRGPLPPTEEAIATWRQRHLQRYRNGDSPFGLSSQDRLLQRVDALFHEVSPTAVGSSRVTVTMPSGSYQLIMQAGYRTGSADQYDNCVAVIRGTNTKPHPEFGNDLWNTVIVGEEVYRITQPQADGTLEPLDLLPSTADAGTYLYAQAYVQFHPVARNFRAEACEDWRVFDGLIPGQQYTFSTRVRGIDAAGSVAVTIDNGRKQEVPRALEDGVLMVSAPNTPPAISFAPLQPLLPEITRYRPSSIDGKPATAMPWVVREVWGDYARDAAARWDGVRDPAKLVWERDARGQQYISLWVQRERSGPFQFIKRSQPVSEPVAEHIMRRAAAIFSFKNFAQILDNFHVPRAPQPAPVGGPSTPAGWDDRGTTAHPQIRHTFTARAKTVSVHFASSGLQRLIRRDQQGWPIDYLPASCDELRFDEIQLRDTDDRIIMPRLKR